MNLGHNHPEIISFPEYDKVDEVLHFTTPEEAIEYFNGLNVVTFPEAVLCPIKMLPPPAELWQTTLGRKNWNMLNAKICSCFEPADPELAGANMAVFTHNRPVNGRRFGVLNTKCMIGFPKELLTHKT